MSGKKPFVVACIPAYNEEGTIAKVVVQTRKYVDRVVVCDDGSSDMTGEIAEQLGAEVLRHERNMVTVGVFARFSGGLASSGRM